MTVNSRCRTYFHSIHVNLIDRSSRWQDVEAVYKQTTCFKSIWLESDLKDDVWGNVRRWTTFIHCCCLSKMFSFVRSRYTSDGTQHSYTSDELNNNNTSSTLRQEAISITKVRCKRRKTWIRSSNSPTTSSVDYNNNNHRYVNMKSTRTHRYLANQFDQSWLINSQGTAERQYDRKRGGERERARAWSGVDEHMCNRQVFDWIEMFAEEWTKEM
jgi:hypothetical protein